MHSEAPYTGIEKVEECEIHLNMMGEDEKCDATGSEWFAFIYQQPLTRHFGDGASGLDSN